MAGFFCSRPWVDLDFPPSVPYCKIIVLLASQENKDSNISLLHRKF